MSHPEIHSKEQAIIRQRDAAESWAKSVREILDRPNPPSHFRDGRPDPFTAAAASLVLSIGFALQEITKSGGDRDLAFQNHNLRERLVGLAALAQLAARELKLEDEVPF